MLVVLKVGGFWDHLASVVKIRAATFQRLSGKFVDIFSLMVLQKSCEITRRKLANEGFTQIGELFKFCSEARYATDRMFQESNRPTKNISENKR